MKISICAVTLVGIGAGALHCTSYASSDASPCASGDACVDGGSDDGGNGFVTQVPPGCDANAEPKDAPKCVVSEFGVFVDGTSGNDVNAGTKESPVKTLGGALGKLGGKSRLYVCEGTYAEHVKITSAVSVYGGFACGTWSYSGGKAKIAPSDVGYALHVENVPSAIVISDLEFASVDATPPGASSIAAFVASSTQVTLRRTTVTAGKGVDGTDATVLADFSPATADGGLSGSDGGGAKANSLCLTSIGGAGGRDTAKNGGAGQVAIAPVYPTVPLSNGAGGSNVAMDCGGGSSGRNGSYGISGTSGPGATKLGELTVSGWRGQDGSEGGRGGDGQGGGGGAQVSSTGVGGGGGPGGCGGAGGGKGTAGGSSIALLVFESAVLLEQSTLVAKDAGRGGSGAKGQTAQLGGAGGAVTNAKACGGGVGGIGGSGGGGGGGAGGVSAGILYKGTAPKVDGAETSATDTLASVTLGQKGVAGTKGTGGAPADPIAPASREGADGTDGVSGEAKAVMSIP